MAARYSPAGHVLLSAAAQSLDAPTLEAYAEAAERELGLRGRTRYVGERGETATLAVVYGVNCLLLREKANLQSESKGKQSRTFAEKVAAESWCAKARKVAASLTGINRLRSLR